MKVNVLPKNENVEATESEKKIIHVAILNILALLNAIITQKGMVSNPIENHPGNLGYEVHFETELSKENESEFMRRVTSQIDTFLTMSEVPYKVEIEG